MRLLLICWVVPFPLLAQFTYTLDQSTQVEKNGKVLKNAWGGGLNSAQVNRMDLNADGSEDLVIFDKTTARISTFLQQDTSYQYAPEYEILFPDELSTFVLLRDYNCDGRKDLFTFGQLGILVFQNVVQSGKPFGWKKLTFFNSSTGGTSEVLLTLGSSGKINLLPGSNDLPDFTDMDGDGDLDVLNMRFVNPNTAEYHKNFSMERYGRCDSLDLERQTSNWGNFLECSCGLIAFQGQTCADIGGRINHTGGKGLLSLDTDSDGDKDLLFTEESCSRIYHLENQGTTAAPILNNLTLFPLDNPVGIITYPAPYLEDVDNDGVRDLLVSPNLHARNQFSNNFRESLWLYKNTGTNQAPVFTFQKRNFLQDEMMEVGDLSAPAFTDIDLDGDQDLFIGSYIDPISFKGSIIYYQNVGTASNPSFKWVTDDFANLSFSSLINIRPQFIDIDNNGGVDLAFTGTNGGTTRLFYLLSTSATAPTFDPLTLQKMELPVGLNGNATLVDVDLDGHLDALVGTSTGALNYWRNTGVENTFLLANDAFLGLGSSPSRQNMASSVGDMDGDGREDLVTGDYYGNLSIYSDFRSAGSNPEPVTELIHDIFSLDYTTRKLGGSLRPAVANVFSVNKPSLVIGNQLGGLHLLKNDNSQPLSDIPIVTLSPNPVVSEESLSIRPDRNVTVQIFTVHGTQIGFDQLIPGNKTTLFPLQGITSGLYVARFTAGTKSVAMRFIIL